MCKNMEIGRKSKKKERKNKDKKNKHSDKKSSTKLERSNPEQLEFTRTKNIFKRENEKKFAEVAKTFEGNLKKLALYLV